MVGGSSETLRPLQRPEGASGNRRLAEGLVTAEIFHEWPCVLREKSPLLLPLVIDRQILIGKQFRDF
jgi:hypothetical protein